MAIPKKSKENRINSNGLKYYVFYKPFGVICQFTPEEFGQKCLKDYLQIDEDIYPIGRLDKDSEGLLLLTNDHKLNKRILAPEKYIQKKYCCQVEGQISPQAVLLLQKGIHVRILKKTCWLKAPFVQILEQTPEFPPRDPPIRFRLNKPDSWVEIGITEGKNHQVRKMLAAVGFPVLRLIRRSIGNLNLDNMQPGDYRKLSLYEIEKNVLNSAL